MTDRELPPPGACVKCVTNRDRPELVADQVYVVVHDAELHGCPINHARWQPDDFRFIAIRIPGAKENGVYPFGIFEVVK